MQKLFRQKNLLPVIIAVALFALYLVFLFKSEASYKANFIAYICLFIIAAQGWNILGGYIGEISFGHAVFWGIGAYTVGLPIGYNYKIPPIVLVFVGAFVAAIFAGLISYPLLRVQGFPFLIGTYGLGVVFEKVFIASPKLFATKGVFLPPSLDRYIVYSLIVFVAIAVTLAVYLLTNTDLGLRFKAVRDDSLAAQMVGVNIYRTKATALVLSAFLAGLAGGFYVLYSGFINPVAAFGFDVSISILLGPYIGGIGSVIGTVFGTTVVIWFQEWARSAVAITGGHHLALGLILVTIMMINREGLYPGIRKLIGKLVEKIRQNNLASAESNI